MKNLIHGEEREQWVHWIFFRVRTVGCTERDQGMTIDRVGLDLVGSMKKVMINRLCRFNPFSGNYQS